MQTCVRCQAECKEKENGQFDAWVFCSLRCATLDWKDVSGVPSIFFETDPNKLECQMQVKEVDAWVKDRNCGNDKPGLLLHGRISRTGKTRLGTRAFNALVISGWFGRADETEAARDGDARGLWFNVHSFVTKYRRLCRENEAKAEWEDQLCRVRHLFIDDLDKIKPTEGLMELVFAVIDDRCSNNRSTIITTNVKGTELVARWGEEVGPYLVGRLREFAECLDFDVRQKPANVLPMEGAA